MDLGNANTAESALDARPNDSQAIPRPPEPLAHIVFYDGNCGLCHGFVRFLAAHDKRAKLRFAPLQGQTFTLLKAVKTTQLEGIDSVVYLDERQQIHTYSSAAIRAVAALGGPWQFTLAAMVVPAPLRDLCYRFVARVRYRLFGRAESCEIPSLEVINRLMP